MTQEITEAAQALGILREDQHWQAMENALCGSVIQNRSDGSSLGTEHDMVWLHHMYSEIGKELRTSEQA